MSKKRVYELAKEHNMTTKEFIKKIEVLDLGISNHMSTLEEKDIKKIDDLFNKKDKKDKKENKKPNGNWSFGTPKGNRAKRKSDFNKPKSKTRDEKDAQKNAKERKAEREARKENNNRENNRPKKEFKNINTKKENKRSEKEYKEKFNKEKKDFRKSDNREKRDFKKSDNREFKKSYDKPKKEFKKSDDIKDTVLAPPILDTEIVKKNTKKNKKKKEKNKRKNTKVNTMETLQDKFTKKIKKKKKKEEKANDTSMYYDGEGNLLVPEALTVAKFAEMLGKPSAEIIMKLMGNGIMVNLNQNIDFDTAELIALEYDIPCTLLVPVDEAELLAEKYFEEDDESELKLRPPVVTVMGHVDHGKTSLLDAIRKTAVTDREAGGITQHIGASEAIINGQKIVFLDTPGHEAFTTLRSRGAQVTDIAVLVVAADDGVMPQTIEAIDHAKAAGVPIIVAINKIDKVGANPNQVKGELADHGVLVEDWGGDVISVEVSAKMNTNINGLLEMILLQAEVLELKANPDRDATGTIIDARVDKGRGTVATLLVQNGTLHVGDSIVCGSTYGRVRALFNHLGKRVKKATPSTGVEITGLNDIPVAGDRFFVAEDDKIARKIAEKKSITERNEALNETPAHVTLEDIFDQIKAGETKELKIVIKADVQGSLEALKTSLGKLSNEEVTVNIIRASIGTITESDVLLASASNAIVIGFNVRPSAIVDNIAKREGVELKTYRIIYEAINDVSDALKGMLDPEYKEEVLGLAEVRQLIKVPNVGVIAGCMILSGKVTRTASFRLIREGIIVHEGKIASLKRFKDDVKEVVKGYECGIGFEDFNELKELDTIEAFHMVEIKK